MHPSFHGYAVSPRENGAHQACHQVGLSIQTKIHTTQLGSRCLSLMGSLSEDMFRMASLSGFQYVRIHNVRGKHMLQQGVRDIEALRIVGG
jgi:hypothetical protein